MNVLGSIPRSSNLSEDYIIIQIYKHEPEEEITPLKTEIQEFFLAKYQPLCNSLSKKYWFLDSVEDNQQECYFSMLRALDYVNLEKSGSSKDFSFGYHFKTYIKSGFQNQVSSKERQYKEATLTISDIVNDDTSNEDKLTPFIQRDHLDDIIFQDAFEKFKKALSPHKRIILEQVMWERLQKTAAEKLGISSPSLSIHLKKIRREYIDFMNRQGYSIKVAVS